MRTLVFVIPLVAPLTGAQEPAPFQRDKIGIPPQLIGLPLLPADALAVDAGGHESPAQVSSAETAETSHAGYPSAGVGPGASLAWTLPPASPASPRLYFLVRSGHQHGYEYVHPEMTYQVTYDGQPVPLEPVYELAAVRVFQSEDSWGHDVGWIRSTAPVAVQPGGRLTIGCTERHAFVSLGLLVSPEAHALTVALGEIEKVGRRVTDARTLLDKIGETFPSTAEVCRAVRAAWDALDVEVATFMTSMDALRERVKAGESPDPKPFSDRAAELARAARETEISTRDRLVDALRGVTPDLAGRERELRLDRPANYSGRESEYARGVAATYLTTAEGFPPPASYRDVRRLATHLWRAKQFLTRAEAAAPKARQAPAPKPQPISLRPIERRSVLLNGVWEMSMEGQPEAPPDDGWFPIRVPHGPWSETIGNFMALDRQWQGEPYAWYRTRFTVPDEMTGGRVLLRFGAVFHLCEAYVNGVFVGRHIGGFDAFEFDITDQVTPGQTVELHCLAYDSSYTALAKSDRKGEATGCSSGPNHYAISDLWGSRHGGIWQDVSLVQRAAAQAAEVLVIPSYRTRSLTVRTTVESHVPVDLVVRQEVLLDGRRVLALPERRLRVEDRAGDEVTESWPDAKPWGIGGPWGDPSNLYTLRTRLFIAGQTEPLDTRYDRFGFREFWIEDGQFQLNGRHLTLQGGGSWYLHESKTPHGNRWWAARFFGIERSMNVNIERWHRHGDVTDTFFDLADELGVLNEPEGPYWGCYGVPDILGYADWDDPVWVANVSEHYRRWVIKHFNHPSIVLWSIENETFTRGQRPEGMLDRFLAFGEVVKATDPTRPITYHGSENGRHATNNPRLEIVNLHYPGNDRTAGWKERWGGRPCIDGEFQNYPPLFLTCTKDRAVAAENMAKLQDWIRAKWDHYRAIELSGSFYFLPYMAGLVSTAKPEWMGPWGDLLGDLEKASVVESGWSKGTARLRATVPITWPSLSGPGIKCEQLRTSLGHTSLINWFDPTRPEATPTPIAATIRDSWQPMPPLRDDTAPEVIVTVTRDGRPVSGVAVMAVPAADQAVPIEGALTDPAGTAWLVFRAAGPYRLVCGGVAVEWEAKRLPRAVKPGWEHIPRLALRLGDG